MTPFQHLKSALVTSIQESGSQGDLVRNLEVWIPILEGRSPTQERKNTEAKDAHPSPNGGSRTAAEICADLKCPFQTLKSFVKRGWLIRVGTNAYDRASFEAGRPAMEDYLRKKQADVVGRGDGHLENQEK